MCVCVWGGGAGSGGGDGVLYMVLVCYVVHIVRSVTLLHSAMGCSVVCDCGIS